MQKAKSFLSDGNYFWNAGIFLLQANILIKEAEKYLKKQLEIARQSIENAKPSDDGCYLIDNKFYDRADDISVDYGILEKSSNVAVTQLISSWSDVGDFNSIHEAKDKDSNQNVIFGEVKTYDSSNCLIYSNNSLITCLGVKNLAIIETDDSILIVDKDRTQDVKRIVKDLVEQGSDKIKLHNRVFRPWGYYETLSQQSNFKVKRILVNPNSSLSLQSHKYRSEHWVVVSGNATVQNDDKILNLKAGESTFIPEEIKHRLSNQSDGVLEIIETQTGSYLGEDDIKRFDDVYGRG